MNIALDPALNVSVSASAGSGKTWQLTARITRILLQGHSPEGILALTFTRKAAAEMRHRVEDRLRQLALASDAELDAALRELDLPAEDPIRQRARGLYEQLLFNPWPLRATTLHAFCQDLVARFPKEAGIAPGFEVLEGEQVLLDAAWATLQKKILGAPQSAAGVALKVLIDEEATENGLRTIVQQFLERRAEWWAYTQDQADPLAFAVARLREQLGIISDDPSAALHTPSFESSLGTLCRGLGLVGKIGQYVRAELVLPALELNGERRYASLVDSLFTQKLTPYGFKPSNEAKKKLDANLDRFVQAHAEVIAVVERAIDQTKRLTTLRRTEAALVLGIAALEEFTSECRARNRYGFTDLEWYASKLLRDADSGHWVQFKLDQRIDHLLLDEFQDTSPTQWQLLLPLLQEMAAGNSGRPRSVFIVGDIKQSIYGFRRANPELLPQAAAWMQAHLDARQQTLSLSRRSAPAIIEWVNALFAPGLIPDFPVHGTAVEGWGRVELAPLIEPDLADEDAADTARNPLLAPRPDPENTRALREGHLIAQRIQALVNERWEISDKGRRRPMSYGDVLILARSRTHLLALEQALTENKVPFMGAARGTLLDTAEAGDIAALLRFLLSPIRDLDLAHVLRSPIFSISSEELIELAMVARKTSCSWRAALAATGHPKLAQAHARLEAWLQLARQLPVHDLLDRIYNEGDLAARYEAALPAAQSQRVRGNLNSFLQLALASDSGRYPSLSGFLKEFSPRKSNKDAPDEAPPPAAQDQVRILTVHGAKGLEAPAVFLAQTISGNSNNRDAGWIVQWPSNAPRPEVFVLAARKDDRDTFSQSLIDERRAREAAEDMNLLYVAATRARQFLHVSAFRPKKENRQQASWYALAADAFKRIGTSTAEGEALVFAQGAPAVCATPALLAAELPDDARLRRPLNLELRTTPRASPQEDVHDAAAVARGNALHWLLQDLSASPGKPASTRRGRLEAAMGAAVRDADFDAWLSEGQSVIAAPALRAFFDPDKFRQAWNEIPISHGESYGIIDRLVDDGQTLWVLDYKTSREGNDAELLERYRDQLLAYSQGVARLWPGRSVRMGLILTNSPRYLELAVA